jgi:hypothetical protein
MDRRRHERYGLQAELSYLWKDPRDVSYHAQGLARDISTGGIFVSTDDLPPTGANVRIDVSIRSILARSRLVIQANGRVVRVQPGPAKGQAGFAAAIETFTLRNEDGEIIE